MNRDEILAFRDLKQEALEIPEWDGAVVNVRALSAGEVEEFGRRINDDGGRGVFSIMAELVVRVLVNEIGERILGDDDVGMIAGKNAQAVKRIFDKAQALSGLGDDEDIEGN